MRSELQLQAFRRSKLWQNPLVRPARPAFWLLVVLLMGCLRVALSEQFHFVTQHPGQWLLSFVLLLATAAPAVYLIVHFDRLAPKPRSLIFGAILWGGIVSITFALYANTYFLDFLEHLLPTRTFQAWGAAIVAPPDEEFFKAAGLLVLFLIGRRHFRSALDGLVYGAAIGLAFQTVENVGYFMHAAAVSQGNGQLTPVLDSYVLRVVLVGLYSHTLFTGLVGFGFGYAVSQTRKPRAARYGVLALSAALAYAGHFLWDSPLLNHLNDGTASGLVMTSLIKGAPFLAFLLLLAFLARRREAHAFCKLIEEETGGKVLAVGEVECLANGFARFKARRQILRTRGREGLRLLRSLQQQQINLALWHAGQPVENDPGPEFRREQIKQLRDQLAQIGEGQTAEPAGRP